MADDSAPPPPPPSQQNRKPARSGRSDTGSDTAALQVALAGRRALDSLLTSKEIIFVTGKGGVGKSALAAALALRCHSLGLEPLLFECDAPPRPPWLPGAQAASREEREVLPGIFAVNQSSDDAVQAYAAAALPSKRIADLLFENRVARVFLRASPSVTEMALVGRVVQLAEQYRDRGPVIVDLHATGHALAMLRAPDGIMRVLRAGPVYERAKIVREVLYDPKRTAICTVALPEELPVTELLEFVESLEEMNAPHALVVINGMFSDPAPLVPNALLDPLQTGPTAQAVQDLRVLRHWAARAQREHARLSASLAAKGDHAPAVVTTPYVFEIAKDQTISGHLAQALAHPEQMGAMP